MCKNCDQCVITLSTPASGSSVTLPVSDRLTRGRIRTISVRRSGSALLYDKQGRTLAADSVIAGVHLSLKNTSGFELVDSPLSVYQRDFNDPNKQCVDYLNVDPQQSVLSVNLSASGYNAAHVIEVQFGLDCDQCGQ